MDPLTQGVLGAAATQAFVGRRVGRRAWLYGAVGGMTADLDVLIRSSDNPLVAFEYHRHFTHSLAFIPIGGLLSALPWILRRSHRPNARRIVLATTVGYATHAFLDACTSYGTLLWWPFSHTRVAWSWVSIVDPLVTIPLIVAVWLSARRCTARAARIGLLWTALYLAWGGVLHGRAVREIEATAHARGHVPERVDAFPSLATNLLWRTTYLDDGRIHVDEVRTPWLGSARSAPGGAISLLTEDDLPAAVRGDARTLEGFRVFRWFTDGWVARHPREPEVIGDLRYGPTLATTLPLWGIRLHPDRAEHVSAWRWKGDFSDTVLRRWHGLWGNRSRE